jgi:hypothetical protein
MKLITTTMILLVSAFVFIPAISGPMAQTNDAAPDTQQQIFETKCQKCHSLDRVKEAHLTREMVKPTIDRMKSKPGADISQTEAETLYEYLSTYFVIPPPPPVLPVPAK